MTSVLSRNSRNPTKLEKSLIKASKRLVIIENKDEIWIIPVKSHISNNTSISKEEALQSIRNVKCTYDLKKGWRIPKTI